MLFRFRSYGFCVMFLIIQVPKFRFTHNLHPPRFHNTFGNVNLIVKTVQTQNSTVR